jgi:hypothetical protein
MLIVGIKEIDYLIKGFETVEFFGNWKYTQLLAHKALASSSYVELLIVQRFGGVNPFLIKRLGGTWDRIKVRRVFKAEEVPTALDSIEGEEVIVINPYLYSKLKDIITAKLRRRAFIFNKGEELPLGGNFNYHSMHEIIKVSKVRKGILVKVIKGKNEGASLTIPLEKVYDNS